MLVYEKEKKIVIGQPHECQTEILATQEVVARVCAQDIAAPIDIKPFDNSTMNRFAIRLNNLDEGDGVLRKAGQNNLPTIYYATDSAGS